MALLDRIFKDGPNQSTHRSQHLLTSALRRVAEGEPNFTVQWLKDALGLDPSDNAQLLQVKNFYEALNPSDRRVFFIDWEDWCILAEKGKVSRSQFAARFGITE